MPNMDYRQFVDRFQAIERRLRAVEIKPNPQLAVAAGKTLTVNHSMTLAGADGRMLTIPATGTAALLATAQTYTALKKFHNTYLTLRSTSAEAAFFQGGIGTSNAPAVEILGPGASYPGTVLLLSSNRVSSSGYNFLRAVIDDDGTPETALLVRGDGRIGVLTATPVAQVHIDQTSATAAIPVLHLDQGDVSEDLIEIAAGSTTGNATTISTDAAGAYAGRIQITVNGVRRWLNFYADA